MDHGNLPLLPPMLDNPPVALDAVRPTRHAFAEAASVLLEQMPALYLALGKPLAALDDLPGWHALRERYHTLRSRGDDLGLTLTLYGPSGAGKSTFFRLLTGTPVPAGGYRRPLTHNCCVALPTAAGLDTEERVQRLFPGFDVRPLESPVQLTEKSADDSSVLYYVSYTPAATPDTHLPLIVADIPDISTIEHSNWDKARQMLARAEIVAFLVYEEGYKNTNTVEHLKHCCQDSAYLAFIFTKRSAMDADTLLRETREMWADLLAYTADAWHAEPLRADGRTLHAFLASAPVYVSAKHETPTLQSFQPLDTDGPPLLSLLGGLDGQRLVYESLYAATIHAVDSLGAALAHAESVTQELEERLRQAHTFLTSTVQQVVTAQFPIGVFLAIVVQEIRVHRSALMRYAARPMDWGYAGFKKVRQGIQGLRHSAQIRPFNELETERLWEGCERLITEWRQEFPAYRSTGGLLSTEHTQRVVREFQAQPLPRMETSWQADVKEMALAWALANRWKARALAASFDLGVLGSLSALGVDLFVGGGIGTITFGYAAAGAGGVLVLLTQILHWFSLDTVFAAAQQRYLTERTATMEAHVMQHLALPLFLQQWQAQLDALHAVSLPALREACATLRQLCASWRRGHV